MSDETPAAHWVREQRETADAAEAEGRYEEQRLANKFRDGEVTFEEVLQLFREGKVYRPEPRYPGSHRFDHVEADEYGDPFANFTLKVPEGLAVSIPHLTAEQWDELMLARSGYVDDGDPRNTPRRDEIALPPPPDSLTSTKAEFLAVYLDESPVALLLAADGNDENVFWLHVDPAEWVPAPATWNLEYGRATGIAVPLDFDGLDELVRSGLLENLAEESFAVLHGLLEQPSPKTDGAATPSGKKKLLGMAHLGKPVSELTDEEIDRIAEELGAKMVAQLREVSGPVSDKPRAADEPQSSLSDRPDLVTGDAAAEPADAQQTIGADLPPPPPGVSGEHLRLYSVAAGGRALALLLAADDQLFRLQVEPPRWVTAPESWSLEYGRATGTVTALDADQLEHLMNSGVLENLTWESLARLHDLLELEAPTADEFVERAGVMWHRRAAARYFDGDLSLDDLIGAIEGGFVTQEMDYARNDNDDEYFEDPFRSRGSEPDGGTERYRKVVEAYRRLEQASSVNLEEFGNWYPSASVDGCGALSVVVSDFSESMQDRSYGVRLDGRRALVHLVSARFAGPGSVREFMDYCGGRAIDLCSPVGEGVVNEVAADDDLVLRFDAAAPWFISSSGVHVVVGWRRLLLALFRGAPGANPVERAESVASGAALTCERWGLGPVI